MAIRVAPSIFAADFSNMKSTVRRMEESGADVIHFDVMDNHFVPNISFGPKFIRDICMMTELPGDAHLMIDLQPDIRPYLQLPVESITLHVEAGERVGELIHAIRDAGKSAGLSLKPATPISELEPYLDELGMILIMSVEPGFSGQGFIPDSLDKIICLKQWLIDTGHEGIEIQVDGGIGRMNWRKVVEAGASNLVMGSAFFTDNDPKELIGQVHQFSDVIPERVK